MTYTLFDWVKENYDDLIADQSNLPQVVTQVLFQNYYEERRGSVVETLTRDLGVAGSSLT